MKPALKNPGIGDLNEQLSGIFSTCRFEIAVLVLPPEFNGEIAELKDCAQLQTVPIPTVLIIENFDLPQFCTVLDRSGNKIDIAGPLTAVNILPHVWQAVEHLGCETSLHCLLPQDFIGEEIIGRETAFLKEVDKIDIAAGSLTNVFISGGIGTGKRLFAKRIHSTGKTADKPFFVFCCGMLPNTFERSGLFKLFTQSNSNILVGSTLFIDEIGWLPDSEQLKLLDFLEWNSEPGGNISRKTCVRVIAGSTASPEDALDSGKLREDLFHQLNVITFDLPILRKRKEDIPMLADFFLGRFFLGNERDTPIFSSEALLKLGEYEWPGNVLELMHTIRNIFNFLEGNIIHEDHLRLPVKKGDSP